MAITGRSAAPPPPTAGEEADAVLQTGFDALERVTVDAMINERGPYRFVVDTGANRSVLSTELAQSLGLAADGQAVVHGIAGMLPSPVTRCRTSRTPEQFLI